MSKISFRAALLTAFAAAVVPVAVSAQVQPTWRTPAGTGLAFQSTSYVIPYATSLPPLGIPTQDLTAETVVTVGANGAGNGCNVQVAWFDFNGALAGVSGPFLVPAENTLEFTSHFAPPGIWSQGQLNVFRNNASQFEGHAKVRSSCGAGVRLRVNAQVVTTDAQSGENKYIHVKVVKLPGNVGD